VPASLRLSWQEGVSRSARDGRIVFEKAGAQFALTEAAPEINDALERLAPPGEDEERLADAVLRRGTPQTFARWHYFLEQLSQRGLVRKTLYVDDAPLATWLPFRGSAASSTRELALPAPSALSSARAPSTAYVLSRFACLRRNGRELQLDSPLSLGRVVLHDGRAAAALAAMAVPSTVHVVAERVADLAPEAASSLIDFLLSAGMVQEVDSQGASPEDQHSALRSWEFHDLLFHTRSRRGRTEAQFGGTYRLADCLPPPPAVKPTHGELIKLDRPDLERLQRDDPPFARVQEQRRSIRTYAEDPIDARQLGEFLFRVARVKDRWQSETPTSGLPIDFATRPYPSGGALYELEFYAAVNSCAQLAPGLYRYEPEGHALAQLDGRTEDLERLLHCAAISTGVDEQQLQVLIVLAARFPRIAWKYESIAYALILKHVGVVMQTMYLAATAMGLAPCAVGCGDADLFARAAKLNYYEETSVGEFLLGSRPASEI
jgi:oxazoline/thiazoline dehydrogenase